MSAKVMELKNKLIKQLEWSLNKHDDLLDRALSWGNWQMECQKKVSEQSQMIWHLEWQVRWLERNLLKINPKIKLYQDKEGKMQSNTRDETHNPMKKGK
tara:strand:+ start:363 stop:659 length:297 start_codon:yes stop_codon:yes gene_type:complete